MGKLEDLKAIIDTVCYNNRMPISGDIKNTTNLRDDLGFDSLALAEFTVRVEAKFGIDVFASGVVKTIQEVIDKLTV